MGQLVAFPHMASVHETRPTNIELYSTETPKKNTDSTLRHFDYETYYKHKEKDPEHHNPLLQYLSDTELKFHNDNIYEASPYGLPRRTDILKDYVKMNPNFEHLNRVYEPNMTLIDKQRYKRCVSQQQQKLHRIKKKFNFVTYDGYTSHYFLTGARYNRFDTVDSKILLKYGTFVNRNNPEQVDIKASHFKKFREILQNQRSSSVDLNSIQNRDEQKQQQQDLDDLTNRYERSSSGQSRIKLPSIGNAKYSNKLPKLNDPGLYVETACQMPERKRGRRSVDRSSSHRSSRSRRQSQQQQQLHSQYQQQLQLQPSSKVSFSHVSDSVKNDTTKMIVRDNTTISNSKNILMDEQNAAGVEDNENEHLHQQFDLNLEDINKPIPDENSNDNTDEVDNSEETMVILREQANVLISNILSAAFDQLANQE
ncbi:unnamed protein product [Didymodactylos carnosus]|uniref:Uncharacterized protein n=1 Tax=Didymodactylos carnosus TaxID=1234261 RepID=A0A814FKC4_9BILA|nr:unnamed protein product [Didymodactylos carnosus]CAF1128754.1 unnamed protein product [Didymodactylos carnosus]CAF3756502.1 unnamed protein product [Didymodactylos carnosus]CAF3909620.1 unnamed protein product [Didymodactylos carnosus]